MEAETSRRSGIAAQSEVLEFTDFPVLTGLILAEWSTFEPVFQNEARLKVYFEFMAGVRNAIAHSRELVDFEKQLLSGMATQLRSQISLYRTEQDPKTMHYPLIESARDSFGQLGRPDYLEDMDQSVRLDVGQRVEVDCRALDHRGRELHWFLAVLNQDSVIINHLKDDEVKIGNEVRLPFEPTEEDVGERFSVVAYMRSEGRFHLHTDNGFSRVQTSWEDFAYDDCRYFHFAVNPPLD